jgi:cytochrome c biogenesis protein CcdA
VLDQATQSLLHAVAASAWLAPFAAFAGGLLTAANPCVLAMVPLMVAYVAGQGEQSVLRSFLLSLAFSIGITLMFVLLFLATWAASSILRAAWWTYIAAAVCLLMGLHLLGLFNWQIPAPTGVTPKQKGFIGAFLLGLLFGLVSLPCAGPILLALLALVPIKGAAYGGLLLVAYSIGHCGLILAGGTSMGLVQRMVDSNGWTRGVGLIRKLAGVLILLVGIFLLAS